jgi:hypothetical protein
MPQRPTPKSLESLHVTLQKLEQTSDPGQDETSIAVLKRVLVNRIADLELTKTFELAEAEIDKAHEPADLVPPPSITEEGTPEMTMDTVQLDKLD